jgi:thiol-disulfide isomerase/thioredoxin
MQSLKIFLMKTILGAILFLSISGLASAQPKVGEQAYEIVLPDANGKVQKLSGQRGKVVLIDFWASWCGPCRKANPGLLTLYTKYKDQGFEIFGVSIDEEKKAWKKAVAADGITWTQVNEPGGWDGPVAVQWKIGQIPTSFLVDQEGKVVAVDPSGDQIEGHLKRLLK